ncbi:twitching motility protein PilH, partial [hydrothermal vent metagenome]
MKQKRALIVDDSKSARLVLRRMLEKHELIVDAVGSAQQALDFLIRNRPDVIFMDHMMPGMDGFEAVKAIKNNPETATIPVMMHTSKGGDLYVGQARALGAVGVLPKTVAPTELFESLHKLGLLDERRRGSRRKHGPTHEDEEDGNTEHDEEAVHQQHVLPPIDMAIQSPLAHPETDYAFNPNLRGLLEEQRTGIRKDILLSMENVARHTAGKLNKDMDEKLSRLSPSETPLPKHPRSRLSAALVTLLLLLSLGWNYSNYRTKSASVNSAGRTADAATAASKSAQAAVAELQSIQAETREMLHSSWVTAAWAMNQTFNYSYDEIALDGDRAMTIETLLAKLREAGFKGSMTLQTHAGEFCLSGSQEEGFRLAAPDTPVEKCDFIGNPVQATDTPSAHQSLSF